MVLVGPYQLKFSILFYSILFYSILFYSILFYSILFYSVAVFLPSVKFLLKTANGSKPLGRSADRCVCRQTDGQKAKLGYFEAMM